MNADIIYCILSLLKPKDVLNCASINKQFHAVSKSELIWKNRCEIDFESITNNYYQNYKEHGILTIFLKKNGITIKLNEIKYLYLWNVKLKLLPKEIGLLTNLEQINLCLNNLKSIPQEIWSLSKLTVLGFSENALESLSEDICLLTDLKSLDLHHNKLPGIPRSMSSLTKLEHLSINHNNFEMIPEQFSSLTNLETFEIDASQKYYVPNNLLNVIDIIC
jgi:Leucine-rich repeat (LRR) protein